MISVADIRQRAVEWSLPEETVEKDYVIGWTLWGIGSDSRLADQWVFKGGTCLKKCYIETYRFSEDLDFTVLPGGPIAPEELYTIFVEILDRIYREAGIDYQSMPPKFKLRPGGQSVEGRIYYIGPRRNPGAAKIKLDLTLNECVAVPPVLREISHPYPEELPQPRHIRCYDFVEVFAEKIRAMSERCRPRDLYDIINLYRRSDLNSVCPVVCDTLRAKCEFKGIPYPTYQALESSPYRQELETEWSNMLAHQLPLLPPFSQFWEELPALFTWLENGVASAPLPSIPMGAGETRADVPSTIASWGLQKPMEIIRFAGANRLCVELGYGGKTRVIEPYSLRRTQDGNLILHALHADDHGHRSYRVDRITSAKLTSRPFKPVYQVELTSAGPLTVLPTTSNAVSLKSSHSVSRRPVSNRKTGLVYVVQCPICRRQFERQQRDTALRPHKMKNSQLQCPGKTGFVVRTKYR